MALQHSMISLFLRLLFMMQRSLCQTCGEVPEAHLYYYAHQNKQLTIQIKRISVAKCLPGEAKGKIWMWSRCGKCKTKNGTRKSTKRVLISTAARSLSFGKFLELSFTQQTFLNRLCSCGHSFDRDFIHFFGYVFTLTWSITYSNQVKVRFLLCLLFLF